MTEEQLQSDDLGRSDAPAYDEFFRLLVEVADKVGESLSVVVNLDGSILTGQMISGGVYFQELGEVFVGGAELAAGDLAGKTADPEQWREIFGSWAEAYPDPEELGLEETKDSGDEGESDASEAEELRPAYFHLRNARMVSGPTVMPPEKREGFLWRGKISSVDGFAFGGMPNGDS